MARKINRRGEIIKMTAVLAVISSLGIGVAAAAIGTMPVPTGLASQTLSAKPGIRLTPAFGRADEDCTVVARPVASNGAVQYVRELVCR